MPLTGNKGEWSEIYVFLRLLATGKLFAADADLNKISGTFYNIWRRKHLTISGIKMS